VEAALSIDPSSARKKSRHGVECYDTASLSPAHRFSYWNETICAFLSPVDSIPGSTERPFSARLRRIDAGRLQVSDLQFSPMRNDRTQKLLHSRPNENFFVALMIAGHGQLRQGERCARPGPGDVVVYDSGHPFTWVFDDDTRMLIAQVPRRTLTARIPASDQIAARTLRADEPCASLISTVLNATVQLATGAEGDGLQRLGTSLADSLAAALEFGLVKGQRSVGHQDMLARAKAILLRRLDDPEFDFAQLVQEAGVSSRTLCRMFAADGTTAMRWLWRQRLEHANRLLRERRVATVSEAAMRSGFNDLSHFARAFRGQYGAVPRSLLHGGGAGEASP